MSGGGCSDRGYTYPRRFHRRLLGEANKLFSSERHYFCFAVDVLIEVILTLGDFIGGCILMRFFAEAGIEAYNY